MSTKLQEIREELGRLGDALAEDVMATGTDELAREDLEEGRDPEAVGAAVRSRVSTVVMAQRRGLLHAARRGYERAAELVARPTAAIKRTVEQKRVDIARVLEKKAELREALTVAYRDGQSASDKDVESMWEDLRALGLIDVDEDT